MRLYQVVLVLLCIGFSGCTEGFEIEENNGSITENVVVEEVDNDSGSLDTTENTVDSSEESIPEFVDTVKDKVSSLFLDQTTNFIYLNSGEVYDLSADFNGISYDYSLEIKEENGNFIIYLDGIRVPISDLSLFFKFTDREFLLNKLGDGKFKLLISKTLSDTDKEEIITNSEITLFVIEKEDHIVLEWEDSLSNVKWYKVMHSTTDSDVKYPEQDAIGVYEYDQEKRFEHWKQKEGVNYYRISVVLEDDSVVHSDVINLIWFED
jgi:hypothetical protein